MTIMTAKVRSVNHVQVQVKFNVLLVVVKDTQAVADCSMVAHLAADQVAI